MDLGFENLARRDLVRSPADHDVCRDADALARLLALLLTAARNTWDLLVTVADSDQS